MHDTDSLVPIGEEIGSKTRDQYTSMQIIQISDNQVMTVLRSKDGQFDIMNDLLSTTLETETFNDKIFKIHKIKDEVDQLLFGAQKVHVVFKKSKHEMRKSIKAGEVTKPSVQQF